MSRKRDASEEGDRSYPRQKKKQRVYTSSDAELAKYYEDLASELNDLRIKAATDLIKNVQARLEDDHRETETASALQTQRKIYVRLIRGLCSSRKAARMGFSIALTELFRIALKLASIDAIQKAISLVEEYTQADGGASSQEKRDHALGRLSGYSAILRSGTLQRSPDVFATTKLVADRIFGIYSQVPWLREECGVVLAEALQSDDDSNQSLVRGIIESMIEAKAARSPEGIVLWLAARANQPDVKLPKDIWHHRDPLNKKELNSVFKIIGQNTLEATEGKGSDSQLGTRRRSPHFAWSTVLRYIHNQDDAKLYERYWLETFDENFFGKSASPEKKALGFQNFAQAITWVPAEYYPTIFSKNFMTSLINQSSQPQRYLHAAARSTLGAIVTKAKTGSSDDVSKLLAMLLLGNGSMSFDKLTGTKTVQEILSSIDGDILSVIVEDFFDTLLSTTSTEKGKGATSPRQAAADQLLSLVRTRDLSQETPEFGELHWLFSLLTVLAAQAFANTENPPTTRSIMASRLFSAINHVLTSNIENALEFPAWLVQSLISEPSKLLVFKDCDDAVSRSLEHAHITFEKLVAIPSLETSDEDAPERRMLRLLFSMTLLQAYAEETDAVELLSDLQQCYNDVLGHRGSKEQGVEAIMDIIMDFASRQSAIHRKLAEEIFSAFAPNLTAASLDSMLQILEEKENVAGQQALFDRQEPADGDEVEEDEDDEEEDDVVDESGDKSSDVDMNGVDDNSENDDVDIIEAGSDVEEVHEDASDSEDSNDNEEDSENDDELALFDAKLASTLQTNDDESDSDADMDDEQMMALEPHLAAIFRERAAAASKDNKPTQKKADHRSAKENITAFKNRVLDLLLIYVRRCSDQLLAVELVLPVLRLIRTTKSKQVAEKAQGLLRVYFETAKKKGWGLDSQVPRTDLSEAARDEFLGLEKRLTDVHAEALLFGSRAHASACSSASLFFARAVLVLGLPSLKKRASSDPKKLAEYAMEHVDSLYIKTKKEKRQQKKGRDSLPGYFWQDWITWSDQVQN